jgi:hypothetical protein
VVFGTGKLISNAEIADRLRSITASWFGDQYGRKNAQTARSVPFLILAMSNVTSSAACIVIAGSIVSTKSATVFLCFQPPSGPLSGAAR